jgi:hypothetical protein
MVKNKVKEQTSSQIKTNTMETMKMENQMGWEHTFGSLVVSMKAVLKMD